MKLFDEGLRTASARHARAVRHSELVRTVVEFLAALAFIIGSVLFFYAPLQLAGTWLFLIGSILFAVRPSIKLVLELHLQQLPVSEDICRHDVTRQAR